MGSLLRALLPLALALPLAACHGDAPAKTGDIGQSHGAAGAPVDPHGPLPSHLIAELDDDGATMLFARRGEGGLVLFTSRGHMWARAVDKSGAPVAAAPKGVPGEDAGPATDIAPGLAAIKATADGYLAVWGEIVAQNRALKLLSLDPAGHPRGPAVLVTQIGDAVRSVDVLPNDKGALVLWEIAREDRAEVNVVPIVDGKPKGSTLQVLKDALGWEAISTARGAAIAAVTTDGQAAPPPAAPTPPPEPKRRKKGAHPTDDPGHDSGTGTGHNGHVVLLEVDGAGRAGASSIVSSAPTAQTDVQLVELAGRYVVAWTDERDLDGAVYVASVEPGGKVSVQPHRATPPFGEQALVSIVGPAFEAGAKPDAKRALLAWEEVAHGPDSDTRLVHLASIGSDGGLGAERATLALAANGPPDVVADGDGWAVTTLAPTPEAAQEKEGPRANSAPKNRDPESEVVPIWPAYARFAADLSLRGAEPVRAQAFAPDFVPDVTRSLSCRAGSCLTLAAGGGQGAPLVVVALPVRPSSWRPAAQRDADDLPPRATASIALGSGEHVAKVAAAELTGGAKLSAWVTYFTSSSAAGTKIKAKPRPAPVAPKEADKDKELEKAVDDVAPPPGKTKPKPKPKEPPKEKPPAEAAERDDAPAARLEVRPISSGAATLASLQKPVLISLNALSIGGVALAPAPAVGNHPPETLLAWVGKERGEPQVFVTKLGPDGKKLAQKGVTVIARKKQTKNGLPSEPSDVAAAFDGQDGWIVAWVDTRDGDAEIYVAKVDRSMTKIVPDKRITDALGDAADVQLLVRGKETWVAWSDARGNPEENGGDIYLARLETAGLKKLAPETRIFASKENSRSPEFTRTPNGVLLSWIEAVPESKTGETDPDAGLRVAELDERGSVIGAPILVRAPGEATLTSAHLACPERPCRGVVTMASKDAVELAAFTLPLGGQVSRLKTISALTGGATADPSLAFASANPTALFFSDDTTGGQGRVRWMQLAW